VTHRRGRREYLTAFANPPPLLRFNLVALRTASRSSVPSCVLHCTCRPAAGRSCWEGAGERRTGGRILEEDAWVGLWRRTWRWCLGGGGHSVLAVFRRVPVFCDLLLTSSRFAAPVSGTLAGGAGCQDGSARPKKLTRPCPFCNLLSTCHYCMCIYTDSLHGMTNKLNSVIKVCPLLISLLEKTVTMRVNIIKLTEIKQCGGFTIAPSDGLRHGENRRGQLGQPTFW
jgi:hypothetical protein